MLHPKEEHFDTGLVFGFDVGTSGLGYAVRRGNRIEHVGVHILDASVGDLKQRRELRRMRRTIRSRKQRLRDLRNLLIEIGLPAPREIPLETPSWLRMKAVAGEKLTPENLHQAIYHLWKHRGYLKAPWANRVERPEAQAEEKGIQVFLGKTKTEMEKRGHRYPCEYQVFLEQNLPGTGAKGHKDILFYRNQLKEEFLQIVEKQSAWYPKLKEYSDKILNGDEVPDNKKHRLHQGVYPPRQARFDNRKPSKCLRCGTHNVCRTDALEYKGFQRELALVNFRVIDARTQEKVKPGEKAREEILNEMTKDRLSRKALEAWAAREEVTLPQGLKKLEYREVEDLLVRDKSEILVKPSPNALAELKALFISKKDIDETWWKEWADKHKYRLIEGHEKIGLPSNNGRSAYCRPCLRALCEEKDENPQAKILIRKGEDTPKALNRYLNEVRDPTVRNRLQVLNKILESLVSQFGKPDLIVIEAVKDTNLGKGKKAKLFLQKRQQANREKREQAQKFLEETNGAFTEDLKRLWVLAREAGFKCPYCLENTSQTLEGVELEHILPRAKGGTKEQVNETAAHESCNRDKADQTPFEAYGRSGRWAFIAKNAADCFSGKKLEIFLSQAPAEEAAEKILSPMKDLQQTAYIARVLREFCLLKFGWLEQDSANQVWRDPVYQKGDIGRRVQFTNGYLTSGLRRSWNLHNLIGDANSPEKSRADVRHHALDALVIACTLPWKAFALRSKGGWRHFDAERQERFDNPFALQRDKVRSLIQAVQPQWKQGVSKRTGAYKITLWGVGVEHGKEVRTQKVKLSSLKIKDIQDVYPEALRKHIEKCWGLFPGSQTIPPKEKFPETFLSSLKNPGNGLPIAKVRFKNDNLKIFKEVQPKGHLQYDTAMGWILYQKDKRWKIHTVKPWEKFEDLKKNLEGAIPLLRNHIVRLEQARDDFKAGAYRIYSVLDEKQIVLRDNLIADSHYGKTSTLESKKPGAQTFMEVFGHNFKTVPKS